MRSIVMFQICTTSSRSRLTHTLFLAFIGFKLGQILRNNPVAPSVRQPSSITLKEITFVIKHYLL